MSEKKTVFGFGALVRETPMWSRWMFRVVFILTTVAAFIVAADPAINADLKIRIGVYLKGMDMLIFGLSKLFGEVKYNQSDTDDDKWG